MGKQIICNICLISGNIVPMEIRDGYFYCPECENESWPDRDGVFTSRWAEQLRNNNNYRSCSLQEGVKVLGGEKKSGKKKDEKMKKPTLQTVNQKMYYQS
ncbi:hypothetical protein [uncultured Sporomusa sp.]|uniref:hypothetical protein n=1 Tax=uncultured Sporomusa sp. TaxID=307249 RepID=UPI0025855C68|nr:hypothetical protein [uncultured Sporomusa sp.]